MCTVTYIPTKNGFCFTSNRDEKASRETIQPTIYINNRKELIFPKDKVAGGTWVATNGNNKITCLLNGAFEGHEKKGPYRKSRGLILIESFNYNDAFAFSENIDLDNIEPFTLLLLNFDDLNSIKFHEFRWDGKVKHLKTLPTDEMQIWSSSTLYNKEVREKRSKIFFDFFKESSTKKDIPKNQLTFHKNKHGLNENEDLIMKGDGDLKTISITQFIINDKNQDLNYFDLTSNKETVLNLLNIKQYA